MEKVPRLGLVRILDQLHRSFAPQDRDRLDAFGLEG
jgi:hypothetical protein